MCLTQNGPTYTSARKLSNMTKLTGRFGHPLYKHRYIKTFVSSLERSSFAALAPLRTHTVLGNILCFHLNKILIWFWAGKAHGSSLTRNSMFITHPHSHYALGGPHQDISMPVLVHKGGRPFNPQRGRVLTPLMPWKKLFSPIIINTKLHSTA